MAVRCEARGCAGMADAVFERRVQGEWMWSFLCVRHLAAGVEINEAVGIECRITRFKAVTRARSPFAHEPSARDGVWKWWDIGGCLTYGS